MLLSFGTSFLLMRRSNCAIQIKRRRRHKRDSWDKHEKHKRQEILRKQQTRDKHCNTVPRQYYHCPIDLPLYPTSPSGHLPRELIRSNPCLLCNNSSKPHLYCIQRSLTHKKIMTTGQIMKDEQRFRTGHCRSTMKYIVLFLLISIWNRGQKVQAKEDTVTTTE